MATHLFLRGLQSVRSKGVRRTLESVLSVGEDVVFELRHGTTTMTRGEHWGLDVTSGNGAFGRDYQPTRVRHFRILMKELALPPQSVLVDFGCGMGRAILAATSFDFRHIVGVEYSPELCEIARRNLTTFRRKTGRGSNVEIVEADAATYNIRADQNVFYVFNAFGPEVLGQVEENLLCSLRRTPRPVWLICNHCDIAGATNGLGTFRLHTELPYGGTYFRTYTNA